MAIFGTNNDDFINGADGVTNGTDDIFGFSGDDTIYGLGGSDNIYGGNDNDVIYGGGGADDIFGGSGSDIIRGGNDADDIDGGSGSDYANYDDSSAGVTVSLISGTGIGGTAQGDELVSIENLSGSWHVDILVGNDSDNVISGLGGGDSLKGSGGDDTIYGGTGNDRLKGGGGEDTLNGGADIDTAAYNGSAAGVNVFLITDTASDGDAEGDELNSIENLIGSSHNDQLWGDNGVNELRGENGADTLKGWGGEDTLYGGNNNDTLYGNDADDTLYGQGGSDTLDGGAGEDTMVGDFGNDTFIVDNADDVVDEDSFEGNDTVRASVDYDLATGVWVETLRTTNDAGLDAIDLNGNGAANTIYGNAGTNILDGEGGADSMYGLNGNDFFFVNNAGDNVYEAAGQGADTVRATVNYQLTAGQEIEALTTTDNNGVGAINLTGNSSAQTIVGNNGFNVLQGLGGDDYLQGRAGHDTLTGGTGDDRFLFNTTLNAGTNVDTITDMTPGDDLIRLDDAFFAGIGALGVLNADAFHIGAAAADAEDRVVYNSATGQMFFDSNGNAAGGSTLFANLATGLALTNTNFEVV